MRSRPSYRMRNRKLRRGMPARRAIRKLAVAARCTGRRSAGTLLDGGALRLEDSKHHALAQLPGLAEGLLRACVLEPPSGELAHDSRQLLVEEPAKQLRRMGFGRAPRLWRRNPMQNPLGQHIAVNAIGREVLHVSVEQAGALAGEDSVAIANHGAHGVARAFQGGAPDSLWAGTEISVQVDARAPRLDLVRIR